MSKSKRELQHESQKECLIDISGLKKVRGNFSLSIPSWQLLPGQVVGLVGPNGAGKSTLLEILAGFEAPDEGRVEVLGQVPWRDVAHVRTRLGFMNDTMPLFDMTIAQLLRLVSGYYERWDQALVEMLLGRFKLNPSDLVKQQSKGQGTRLRLLLSMAFQPLILCLDEPASGLDLAGRRALLATVLDVVQDIGKSVIISSHALTDVERIADRLLVLNEGNIVKEGPTDTLVGDDRTLEESLLAWGAAG